ALGVVLIAPIKSDDGPVVSAATTDWLCPSSSTKRSVFCVKQAACCSTGRSKHCWSILICSVLAICTDRSWSAVGSESEVFRISLRYFSSRERYSPAWFRSCVALTNTPGTDRTALRSVTKPPLVSGARNPSTCWASFGTVTTIPSSRTFLFHVSARVNQSSGGGFVDPRKNATIIR